MREYKNAQDLILKAALYDGVSTTIRPGTNIYCSPIEVVFSRGEHRCAVSFDFVRDDERYILFGLKQALFNLLEYPYKDIVVEEN